MLLYRCLSASGLTNSNKARRARCITLSPIHVSKAPRRFSTFKKFVKIVGPTPDNNFGTAVPEMEPGKSFRGRRAITDRWLAWP